MKSGECRVFELSAGIKFIGSSDILQGFLSRDYRERETLVSELPRLVSGVAESKNS